jgi:hypothetical protein
VIEMLRTHELSLSTLAQAESLLGAANEPKELLERLAGKSHREVERVVALERPVPRKPKEIVRRVAMKPKTSDMPLLESPATEPVEFFLKHKAPRQRKPAKPRPRTRHIPMAVRDQVMLRDMQRCTFRSRSGRKCDSTHKLQIDHIRPFALGGTHDPTNLRVLCAAHNRHVARKVVDELSLRKTRCASPGAGSGRRAGFRTGQTRS